jgi:hypothetical protein
MTLSDSWRGEDTAPYLNHAATLHSRQPPFSFSRTTINNKAATLRFTKILGRFTGMADIDPIMMKGIIGFSIPVALGACSYFFATVTARFISPVPRHLYIGRLIFLVLFLAVCCFFYPPAEAFSGSRERYFTSGFGVRSHAAFVGMQTYWVWLIIAALKRPRKTYDDSDLTRR